MNDEETNAEETKENTKLNKLDFLKIISNALKMGSIDSSQATQLRREIGVNPSSFTKKQVGKQEKRRKRKAQKNARKLNAHTGFKGQKMSKGKSSGRGR